MPINKPIPIWEFRPRIAIERRAKYHYALDQGLTKQEAYKARDWDYTRIDAYIALKKREKMGVK